MQQPLHIPIDVKQKEVTGSLDRKAICVWMAMGFMLNNDTFYENVKWDRPEIEPWYYKPEKISFNNAVEAYAKVFEEVVASQVSSEKVLLALSGGLDSRTLAVALYRLGIKPQAYSYKFQNSFDETQYGRKISEIANWDFNEYIIPEGYLWDVIETAGEINQCYSEFTHARQMAVMEQVANKGGLFLLGHWGDVLFDSMHVTETTTEKELASIILKKMLKKGGFELGNDMWKSWNLEGDFKDYLETRVAELLSEIKIDNVNARVRAFKSMDTFS